MIAITFANETTTPVLAPLGEAWVTKGIYGVPQMRYNTRLYYEPLQPPGVGWVTFNPESRWTLFWRWLTGG